MPNNTDHLPTVAQLITQASRHYDAGDYNAAYSLYQDALAIQERQTGPDHPDTARCLHGLGETLIELGDYAQAQAHLERALGMNQRALGAEHLQTASCLNTLGVLRLYQADAPAARSLIEQGLLIRERTLGLDHPETIESLNNLAVVVNRLGDRAQAIAMHEDALGRCERALGEKHQRTAETLNYLAVRFAADKHTYARARALYERSLAILEQLFDQQHPMVANVMSNLAALLSDMGDASAAQALLERSLAMHEQIFGPKHQRLTYVLINLADVYDAQDNPAARRLYERALIISEQTLGAQHPETLRTLRRLVSFLGDQRDPSSMAQAMPFYTCLMALEAAAGTLSPDNMGMPGVHLGAEKAAAQLHELVGKLEAEHKHLPLSADAQGTLQRAEVLQEQAEVHIENGNYEAARTSLEQALALRQQVHGIDHIDHVPLLRRLEEVMRVLGRPSAALPLRERIAHIHEQVLGPNHPHTIMALTELMSLQEYEYGPGTSTEVQGRILQGMLDQLGPNDPMVQMMMSTMQRIHEIPDNPESEEKGGFLSGLWNKLKSLGSIRQVPQLSRSQRLEQALAQLSPERERLLAGIEQIDWRNLSHAYGSAADVPDLLRMLLSEDPDVCDDALDQLFGNIWHQGTVYEASAYAVPFLLRILADRRTPIRHALLGLLSALATGSSYLAVHQREGHEGFDFRDILAKEGHDLDVELQRELDWVRAANEAVAEGTTIFLGLLDEDDEDLHYQVLEVLSSLKSRASAIVPRLRERLGETRSPALRAAIVQTLHYLMDDSPASQQFFDGIRQQQDDQRVVLIAAGALIMRAREQAPASAVEMLLNSLGELEAEVEDDDESSALHFSLQSLFALGGERARAALLLALHTIQDQGISEQLAGMLLDLVFNDGQIQQKSTAYSRDDDGKTRISYWEPDPQPERTANALNTGQREVLTALVSHDPLWKVRSDLLRLYGLPSERSALRRFLDQM